MELLSYAGAVLIGVSLGLIGAGGSILTVPVLVYGLHVPPVLATAYSLFIVGLTSLVGAFNYMQRGLVNYRTAVVFAIPSLIAVYLTRRFLLPMIPEQVLQIGGFQLSKDIAIMVLFGAFMVAASVSMIRKSGNGNGIVPGSENDVDEPSVAPPVATFRVPLIIAEGGVVGVLTGLVGAGGGFLIIPALAVLSGLPMKMAVGTSLLIIAAKSLIGFLGDLGTGGDIAWSMLIVFTALAVGGIFAGSYLSHRISNERLKPLFGWFVLVMGVYIFMRELLVF